MSSTHQEFPGFRQEVARAVQWPNKLDRNEAGPETPDIDKFVPVTDIEALTSRVMEVLENSGREDLLARIYNTNSPAKKIFLILALTDMLEVKEEFISGDFSDHHLPITTSELDDTCVAKSRQGDKLFQRSNLARSQLGWFEAQQWRFLSPVFKNHFEFDLLPRIPLPLIEKDKRTRSGFSDVYKVKVHPAHISRESRVSQ